MSGNNIAGDDYLYSDNLQENLDSDVNDFIDAFNDWVDDQQDELEGEELEEFEAFLPNVDNATDIIDLDMKDLGEFGSNWATEQTDIESLSQFIDELNGYGDFDHGETIIHENEFTEYCKQLCIDCGDVSKDLPHYISIDWDDTAENLKVDYMSAEWEGHTYYMRA